VIRPEPSVDGGFAPLRDRDGYPPIEDHGLIGDGATAALVARDGAVAWLCAPRFDSPPIFARLLDARRGGHWRIAPADAAESRQAYVEDTGLLVTELRGPSGAVRITDALVLRPDADLSGQQRAGTGELLRDVRVLGGTVRLRLELGAPAGAVVERGGDGLSFHRRDRPDFTVRLGASRALTGEVTELDLESGEGLSAWLRWRLEGEGRPPVGDSEATVDERLAGTVRAWRAWAARIDYGGPHPDRVRRSAITLKLLDDLPGGAIVAAPTSSLPEVIGGSRNWDYRYAWIRDTAFAVYALHRIGLSREAASFLSWALEATSRSDRPRVLYDLDGRPPPAEQQEPGLEGYRRSAPVRWGNAAADQVQHDLYGEILDCAHQWARNHGTIDPPLWQQLRALVEAAAREWRLPDCGIWEVRTPGRPFTYSAALCQVALDRGARLAESFGHDADASRWGAAAADVRRRILDEAWNDELGSFAETLGGNTLDASLLALPLRRVIEADDPRMVATTAAVERRLGAGDGLLHRYLPEESPDGVGGEEGAFLLPSFWLVDNWAYQGRLDEALELYERLCARGGRLGLLPEQVDPSTGAFLGNYPQAFSHVGLISSGVTLRKLTEGKLPRRGRRGAVRDVPAPSSG
jgi:GH15 family glucan-1,4-alpha-glucosidase